MKLNKTILSVAAAGLVILGAQFASAQSADIKTGQRVVSSDGQVVGTITSKPRINGGKARIFLRTQIGGVFSRRSVPAVIDVPQDALSSKNGALVLPATQQKMRQRAITPNASDDERVIRLFL